jgi:hypothetical protein
LLRKPVNRDIVGKLGMRCIVRSLMRQAQRVTVATAEIGNVTLNCCYSGSNVVLLIEEGGLEPLMQLLRCRDFSVQASALGALQSVCFVSWGRRALLSDASVMAVRISYLCNVDDAGNC